MRMRLLAMLLIMLMGMCSSFMVLYAKTKSLLWLGAYLVAGLMLVAFYHEVI